MDFFEQLEVPWSDLHFFWLFIADWPELIESAESPMADGDASANGGIKDASGDDADGGVKDGDAMLVVEEMMKMLLMVGQKMAQIKVLVTEWWKDVEYCLDLKML